jgi:hypothetical protein
MINDNIRTVSRTLSASSYSALASAHTIAVSRWHLRNLTKAMTFSEPQQENRRLTVWLSKRNEKLEKENQERQNNQK